MLKRSIILCAAALSPGSSLQAQNLHKVDVPIMIGGGENQNEACEEGADIVGLDPHGDGFLSVRSGPGGKQFREIDRVYNGMHVKVCGENGTWSAIVYDPSGDYRGCNVDGPWLTRMAYTGPCRYGWAFAKYVGNRRN